MQPIHTRLDIQWDSWGLPIEERDTLRKNFEDTAQIAAEEIWNTLDLTICTDGLAIGCLEICSEAEETIAYFRIADLAREAAHNIATNYSDPYRTANIQEVKRHMAAVRDAFQAALSILDQAVENPSRFKEPQSTSQIDPPTEEVLNYLKRISGR